MKNIRGMWRMRWQLWAKALLPLLIVTAIAPQSAAAAASGGNGLRVSPVRTDLVIKPGETQVVSVSVTNVTSQPASLKSIVNDFVAGSDETGNPAIIFDPSVYAPSHSLKRFTSTPPDFTLQPGQQKSIAVTITVPKNAPGGGYFGVVRFGPAGTNSNDRVISLASSVGSLILVKVPGDIRENMSVASFDVRQNDHPGNLFTSGKNLEALIRFQNYGNIQEAPFGKILLMNRNNKIISSFEINNFSPPGNVLPDSIRRFSVPISKVGSLGEYKLSGNFGYGASGQLLSASTTFYVIPENIIVGFVLLVALIVFLVFGMPRLVKAYNRSVVRRARRL